MSIQAENSWMLPREIAKNFLRSFTVLFPQPSAKFKIAEIAARSAWSFNGARPGQFGIRLAKFS